jgi:acetyltransferase EpsM
MNPYAIYGASGHGKVIIEILENLGLPIFALFDDDERKKTLLGYEVKNDSKMFEREEIQWIIAVGDNKTRKKIAGDHFLQYGRAIDQSARISKRAEIGSGTVIMPGVSINSSSNIGKHVIVNTNSSVDHDCLIEDFVHISPNATLCGGVSVGEGTQIGAGAVVIPGIQIGKWVKVGAGAVIIRNVADGATIVGNPGRRIKGLTG